MKVLVVGGLGFLGKNILKKFFHNKKYELYVYDLFSGQSKEKDLLTNVKILYSKDITLKNLLSDYKFELIINTAVIYDSDKTSKIYDTNFKMPLKLIEYSKHMNKISYIFFDTFFSKFNYNKKVEYVNSKKKLLETLKKSKNIKLIMLKLEHMYGPNDSKTKFVEFIKDSLLKNKKSIRLTDCTQKRDFIHVDDVSNLILELIKKINIFDSKLYEFEIGHGYSITVKKFVQTMKDVSKSKTNLLFGSITNNPHEIKNSYADIKSLPSFIDWKPLINYREGITSLFN